MDYVENPDLPQFPRDAACAAARIDLATLEDWASQVPPALPAAEDDKADPSRGPVLSFRQVMQVAIAADLVKLGFTPERAYVVAGRFSDMGDGSPGLHNEVITKARWPGQLYPVGFTILVARHDNEAANVLNVGRSTTFADMLTDSLWPDEAVVLVNINAIDRRVRGSLGLSIDWAVKPVS
jgi:hypothetical protein